VTESPEPTSDPLAWNDLVGIALLVMAGTIALGTSIGWYAVRDCGDGLCSRLSAAVQLLIGLGYVGAAALFFGSLVFFVASSRQPARGASGTSNR